MPRLETPLKDFVCSWVHRPEYYLRQLQYLGFNLIRLPYSQEYVMNDDFSKMDEIMEVCQRLNISVVLDLHRICNAHQDATPEEHTTLECTIFTWKKILGRYQHYSVLIGHNAYNEYQGTDINYLTYYHKRIFNSVEEEYPQRFKYFACGYVWSGNLSGFTLEDLPYHDRIFYSVDENDWEQSFGTLFPPDKLIVGEWGWKHQNPNEVEWATRFISYLKKKKIMHTCFWTIAHSGDTDGIYFDDCENIDWEKFKLLKTLWEDRRLLRGLTNSTSTLPDLNPIFAIA
jgi:aryl-phospho-beta-D-glucosidase BglC (GH1 family)